MPSHDAASSTNRIKLALAAGLIVSLFALFSHLAASFDGERAGGGGRSLTNWWTSDQIQKITAQDDRLSACAPCPSSALDCPAPPQCEDRAISHLTKQPSALSKSEAHCSSTVNQTLVDTYGLHSLRLSQAHTGSSFRVQRFLSKLTRGEKVIVSVIGGSVSMGHGKAGPASIRDRDAIWHSFVRRWLDQIATEAVSGRKGVVKKSTVEFRMGAKAACGSDYFVWCYPAHIGTDADLVLLESAVNDGFSPEFSAIAETLLRSLLSLPSSPAVIYVDSFGQNAVSGDRMVQNGADAHGHLAVRYDVPQISLRAAALTEMMAHRAPGLAEGARGKGMGNAWYAGDTKHISVLPHKMLGELVVAYFEEQLCEARRGGWERERKEWAGGEEDDLPGMDTLGELPPSWTNQAWDAPAPASFPAPPTCHMAMPAKEKSPYRLIPATRSPPKDWEIYSWGKEKHYYQTTVADSGPIAFNVKLAKGARGEVAVGFLRSVQYDLGKARCAVKKNGKVLGEKVIDSYWDRLISVAQSEVIARGLAPGEYTVECRTVPEREQQTKKHAFRIISIMSV